MNISNKKNKLVFSNYVNELKIKNVNISKYIIVYTDNCTVTVSYNGGIHTYEQNSFIFMAKNTKVSANIKKIDHRAPPYKYLALDEKSILSVKNIIEGGCGYSTSLININENSTGVKRIVGVKSDVQLVNTFNKILNTEDRLIQMLKTAYLCCKAENKVDVLNSLYISSATIFTDKIRQIIETDLSKRWRLSDVSEIFNVSDITIRKRLEAEKNSFNQILLSSKMNKSMQLLLRGDYQICQIAKLTGFSNSSYFVKIFKEHYGITPKQFFIYFKVN
ncbi:helix-turn-helix transcriptional regulator [Escherichia coli]